MRYLVLMIISSLCFNVFASISEDAQEYTLQKQRELRQRRLVGEKEKVEALAKQKKQLRLKQKREEMRRKFGMDNE